MAREQEPRCFPTRDAREDDVLLPVDADYLDTEKFYAETEGASVDRGWPEVTVIVDGLIASFDAYMTDMTGPLGRLRSESLAHARGKAALPRGVIVLPRA